MDNSGGCNAPDIRWPRTFFGREARLGQLIFSEDELASSSSERLPALLLLVGEVVPPPTVNFARRAGESRCSGDEGSPWMLRVGMEGRVGVTTTDDEVAATIGRVARREFVELLRGIPGRGAPALLKSRIPWLILVDALADEERVASMRQSKQGVVALAGNSERGVTRPKDQKSNANRLVSGGRAYRNGCCAR